MESLTRVARELMAAVQGDRSRVVERLCAACTRALPVDGAAIAMLASSGRPVVHSTSDALVAQLEELQFTLGEGPGPAAFARGGAAAAKDLEQADPRWPVFVSQAAAVQRGTDRRFRAVFAFPLALGSAPLGVLDLYRREPGELDAELRAQAQLAVDTVALALIGTASPDGDGADLGWLHEALESDIEVDQAVGMTMVQLGVGADEALARLRGVAFANGRMISEVAREVVSRRLRFSREDR